MIKINESIAFHKACKKLKPKPIEADPSVALKPVVRKEVKVKPAEIQKQGDADAV
jgi:hypothetical protein